jgi:hypothetical protein
MGSIVIYLKGESIMRKVVIANSYPITDSNEISVYEYLKKWSNDPDVYISFTEIDKLGINPNYSTGPGAAGSPQGIYFYPLKSIWSGYEIGKYKSLIRLPFAKNRPYLWVVRSKNEKGFIKDISTDYTWHNWPKDFTILRSLWVKPGVRDCGMFENLIERIESKSPNNIEKIFWSVVENVAAALMGAKVGTPGVYCKKWAEILLNCGYTGFSDPQGKGIIHTFEYIQTVFLTPDAYTVIARYDNNKDSRTIVEDMDSFIKSLKYLNSHPDDEDFQHSIDLMNWLLQKDGDSEFELYEVNLKTDCKKILKNCTSEQEKELSKLCLHFAKTTTLRKPWIESEKEFSELYAKMKGGK